MLTRFQYDKYDGGESRDENSLPEKIYERPAGCFDKKVTQH
jgi:hypothetical protein